MIRFGRFILDTSSSKLLKGPVEVPIEPKLYQLLQLFLAKPNQVLAREELVEHLWAGRYVTDNAINKQVANLRRVLDDDPKRAEYIQTVPKLGYRLICDVSHSSNAPLNSASETKVDQGSSYNKVLFLFAFIISSMFGASFFFIDQLSQDRVITYTQELTRQEGQEFSPRAVINSDKVLYLRRTINQRKPELWLKDLTTGKSKAVATQDFSIFRLIAGRSEMVQGNEQLSVYFVHLLNSVCTFYQGNIVNNEITQPKALFDCSHRQISDVDYNEARQQIYYTARSGEVVEYQVYRYDLASQQHQELAQPERSGMGNHSIDVSPDGNKLLILSTDFKRISRLYVLDLTTQQVSQHNTFDYFVSEVVWHHDNEQVYYFAPPPSHQILLGDIDGKEAVSVVSVSDFIGADFKRLNDGASLLFSTQGRNFNNRHLIVGSEKEAKKTPLKFNNSTVYDVIPALMHQQNKYFFVSKRLGKSQIFFGDLTTGDAELVSNFADYQVIRFLQISPDDKTLAIATQNSIWLVSVSDLMAGNFELEASKKIYFSELPITEIDWLDAHHLALSTLENQLEQIINIQDNQPVAKDLSRWRHLLSDHGALSEDGEPSDLYAVEKSSNQIYKTEVKGYFSGDDELVYTGVTIPNHAFHLEVYQGELTYITRLKGEYKLTRVDLTEPSVSSQTPLAGYFNYDVAAMGLVLSELVSIDGDLHRSINTTAP